MIGINNYEIYTNGMAKSLEDKMFFLPFVSDKIASVLDYGCADGVLLKALQKENLNLQLVGYDIDPNMVQKANTEQSGIVFSSDLKECMSQIAANKSALVLSSVIHEVYSYGTQESVNSFWDLVLNSGFQYIFLRDFSCNKETDRKANLDDKLKLVKNGNEIQLLDYIDTWGKIFSQKQIIHYLLKYRYTENWKREVKENYLPLTTEELISKLSSKYRIIYQQHYTLPFLKKKVLEDFQISIEDPTHIQMVLKMR